MKIAQPNFSIVVNWKTRGFGCAKVCSYCNWRDSPLLPHGGQSAEAVSAFIRQCKKPFITISGGADPLYKFDEYVDQLLAMIRTIKAEGFKVRIITREVQHVSKLRGIADHFSLSLDAETLEEVRAYQHEWSGMDVEYSLVLPPIPTADIIMLKPQYATLRGDLGRRLVLRENLNSIYPLDFAKLSFDHSGIVYVPKALCLGSRYLATIDCVGHDIVQDNEGLANYLMNDPAIYLFGGFVKHLVNPVVHMDYDDIDVVVTNPDVIKNLETNFSFTFKAVSPVNSYPRYFQGTSSRAGKSIQLILMCTAADAFQFICKTPQYEIDRIGYSNSRFIVDGAVGEDVIRCAIDSKNASAVKGPRDLTLCHGGREETERVHRVKLLKRGFSITE